MKDYGEILKCIIAFILGYIVANMWHKDGFSIGAPAGHCKVLTKKYNGDGHKVSQKICSQNNCAYAIMNDGEEAFCLDDAECNSEYWDNRVQRGDVSIVGCKDKNFAGDDSDVSGVRGVDIYINEIGECIDTEDSYRGGCGPDSCDNIQRVGQCNSPCCKWVPR